MLFVPLAAIFAEALRKGVGVYFASFTDPHALSAIQHDAARGGDLRAAEPGVRPGRGLGDRQVSVPRQEPADHADRPAVRRVAGDLRA